MYEIHGINFDEISLKDIEKLVSDKLPENYNLEYKRTLSAKKGSTDGWVEGRNNIGEYAKEKIAKEVVAFANAEGGIIILGIEETKTKPARAKEIYPIPKPFDLAERFLQILREKIEPLVANLKIKGIETSDKKGIVVIKVEKSIEAPHRSLYDNLCYIRRNHSSKPMTMHEIKDLTLSRYHEFDRLNHQFEKRAELFRDRLTHKKIPVTYDQNKEYLAVRTTFIPVTARVLFSELQGKRYSPISNTLKVLIDNRVKEYMMANAFSTGFLRPILRGTSIWGNRIYVEVKENGVIDYYYIAQEKGEERPYLISESLIAQVYKGLCFIDELLTEYKYSDIKYGFDIEIFTNQKNFNVFLPEFHDSGHNLINESEALFPRYVYQSGMEKETLLNDINRDFAHYCGYSNFREFSLLG